MKADIGNSGVYAVQVGLYRITESGTTLRQGGSSGSAQVSLVFVYFRRVGIEYSVGGGG